LGLLDIATTMTGEKTLTRVTARHVATNVPVTGYEIHIGRTSGPDCARAFAMIEGVPDGAASVDGRIVGTYLHGMFTADDFRAAFLRSLGAVPSDYRHGPSVDATLDALATHLEAYLDVAGLFALAR
jgi:adenosylcobyric acid synthase